MEKQKRKNETPRPNPFLMIVKFVWSLVTGTAQGIWWMIQKVASGIRWSVSKGASGAWVAVQYVMYSAWWFIKQPFRLLHYILNGRIPEFDSNREAEIFWRVKRRFRRKRLFFLNLVLHLMGIFVSLGIVLDSYLTWQRAIEFGWQRPEFYERVYQSNALQLGIFMGFWTILLFVHFAFNRMGNAEDEAIGDALDAEYARTEQREHRVIIPNIQRLEDSSYDEDYDYYDEEKPKRNGASL